MNVDKLINTYFVLTEASDLILRTAIKQHELDCVGRGGAPKMKQGLKLAHNRLMQSAKAFSHNYEQYYDNLYGEAFQKYESWDELRREANYIIRLVLLIGDRTYEAKEIEEKVEEFVKNLPKRANLNEEVLELFKMR